MTKSMGQMAADARECVRLLNFPVDMGHCLSGEPGDCGLSDTEHAFGFFAVIHAVTGHYLGHAGDDPLVKAHLEGIEREAARIMRESCTVH